MSVSIEKTKGMHIHKWIHISYSRGGSHCYGPLLQRTGTLADKAGKRKKCQEKEAECDRISITSEEIENVASFEYLRGLIPNDRDGETDAKHRMDIAKSVF